MHTRRNSPRIKKYLKIKMKEIDTIIRDFYTW